ncbi:MAG: nucleotidyl transferase AbiEii/AbiGii toxin family protein [Anaerovoracaceae bacterium]
MINFDKVTLERTAKNFGFMPATFEKVYRLINVLQFLNLDDYLKKYLALKGGTAINLTLFDLPRLSVDIDLDYCNDNTREQMLLEREIITEKINAYMLSDGYITKNVSKFSHSLDSLVYGYSTLFGGTDNLKIEINYSLRTHIFETANRTVITKVFENSPNLKIVNIVEIYAAKINALLSRGLARDLYDVNNMIFAKVLSKEESNLLRKSILFYSVLSGNENVINLNFSSIDNIDNRKVKRGLYPVISSAEKFDLVIVKEKVSIYLKELLVYTEKEKQFIKEFNLGNYQPELLFSDSDIINRIQKHPMIAWELLNQKTKN